MKAKYFSYSLAILLTAVAGCTKEASDLQIEGKQKIVISADCATKTYGVETIKFHSKDKLTVFDTNGANNEFALPADAPTPGNAPATFEGEITSGSQPQYVVYPYDANASIAGDVMTVTVPDHYTPGNANSVLRGMNISVGEIQNNEGVYTATLKNLCGIVGVEVGSYAIGLKNVKLSANEPLTGTVSFKSENGVPEVVGVADGHTSVDFDVMRDSKTNLVTAGKFYFSVIPGTYTGLKLTLTLASGETKEITTDKSLTVTRGSRTLLPVTLADIQNAPYGRTQGQFQVSVNFYNGGKGNNKAFYYDNNGTVAYLPTAGGSELTESMTFYADCTVDGTVYSFPFHIIAGTDSKYRYQGGSYYSLLMQPGTNMCIVCPAIPGHYLHQAMFSAGGTTGESFIVSNVYGRENLTSDNSVEFTGSTYVGNKGEGSARTISTKCGTETNRLYYIYPGKTDARLQIVTLIYKEAL